LYIAFSPKSEKKHHATTKGYPQKSNRLRASRSRRVVELMTDFLCRLSKVTRAGAGWTARCPAHDDHCNSLSVHHRDGRWLLKCHAGCEWNEIVHALGVEAAALFDEPCGEAGRLIPKNNRATAQPSKKASKGAIAVRTLMPTKSSVQIGTGLTLDQYAGAKNIPAEFLRTLGLTEIYYDRMPALRIPYRGVAGEEQAVRIRIGLDGDRFRWKSGSKPLLYGLHRIGDARKAGYVALVEGESDCHTLWHHGIPALGVPGATSWREDRDAAHLIGIDTIYVVVEPDRGGDAVREWLGRSSIRHRAKLVRLPAKDPSALHMEGPGGFRNCWQVACDGAIPWAQAEAESDAAERGDAWQLCGALAGKADILRELADKLSELGLVGERRVAKLIYLALTSRLLDRPVSIVVKGPSSGGKSFVVESTLKLFPPEAFYALSAMSDRALAYSSEPLQHRHLVIYEAAGMASEFATYLIRTLLSEGRLRYETVEKTKDGLTPRLIEREGPTGLIVTTTSLRLHPENETRMLSLTITDTQDQTAAVFRALARDGQQPEVDVSHWRALQTWLERGPTDVVIPFADRLAQIIPPLAVRLRRDFKTVLMLIRAHALLHQATRSKDETGRVVATLDDYGAVRELVADLVAEGIDANVKPEVRETVEAVSRLLDDGSAEVRQIDLARVLKLDKSSISRRVGAALDSGFLKNVEDRKGRPARLVLGDPFPEDLEVLPSVDRFAIEPLLHGCAVETTDIKARPRSLPSVSALRTSGTLGTDGTMITPRDAGAMKGERVCSFLGATQ
jgi:hypothetical protein